MCHTTTPEQMPLTNPYSGAPTGDPGMDAANSLAASSVPGTVTVQKPTKFGRAVELLTGGRYDPTGGEDTGAGGIRGINEGGNSPVWVDRWGGGTGGGGHLTKWGMLARVIGPALQGGLIGLAGGKDHPGGGFGAAQDYFNQQRAFQMQKMLLERQQYNDQFKNLLEYARTQHEMSLPPMTRVPNAIKGTDADGNEIYMTMNPRTMRYEPVQGITPESNTDYATSNTDQGIVTYDKRGKAPTKLLTLPGNGGSPARIPAGPPQGAQPTNTAPSEFDSGSPRVPGSGTASQSPSGVAASIPLRPSGFSAPKATIRASRNAAGVETDNVYDENPNSPTFGKKVGALGNTRMPVPDRAAGRADKTNDVNSQIETYASEALKRNGNDPDKAIQFMNGLQVGDSDAQKKLQAMLPKIRQHIRDRVKQGKKRLTLTPEEQKAAGVTPTSSSVTGEEDDEQ